MLSNWLKGFIPKSCFQQFHVDERFYVFTHRTFELGLNSSIRLDSRNDKSEKSA